MVPTANIIDWTKHTPNTLEQLIFDIKAKAQQEAKAKREAEAKAAEEAAKEKAEEATDAKEPDLPVRPVTREVDKKTELKKVK